MKKYIIFSLLLVAAVRTASAEDIKYPVFTIKPEMLVHADVVVRLDENQFQILSANKAILKVHRVITIINEKAKNQASLLLNYDNSRKVNYIKGIVYNKLGMPIDRVKNKDIIDRSWVSGYSLYEDDRCKQVILTPLEYPVTVEYEYEIEFNNRPIYPQWQPLEDNNIAVEESSMTVICDDGITFRYKEKNLQQPVEIVQKDKKQCYSWKVTNLKALEKEPFAPPLDEFTPAVFTAPAMLSYKDYNGSFTSWDDLGKWTLYLNKGRQELPVETRAKITELVQNIPDERGKIRAIYEYMQSKTRYVSIQIGIGGLQPFPAEFVDKNGYGDCKALVNYTMALLHVAGIESYYTLVKAGEFASNIPSDFPCDRFNHIILCVPCQKDTIWLECTDQVIPFGFQGTFTDDREVLVVNPAGSKLTRTHVYPMKENLLTRTATVDINNALMADAKVYTNYSGLKYEDVDKLLDMVVEEQKRELAKTIDLPGFDIYNIAYQRKKNILPWAGEKLSLHIPSYASVSGNRLFVPLNLMDKETYIPEKLENRTSDILFRHDDCTMDTIVYSVPSGYQPEHIPDSVHLKSVFGEYSARTFLKEGKLVYIRSYAIFKGRYPATAYNDLIDFCKKIAKADREKAIFIRQ